MIGMLAYAIVPSSYYYVKQKASRADSIADTIAAADTLRREATRYTISTADTLRLHR